MALRLGLAGAPSLGSWVALPLLLEGVGVGVLVAGRTAVDAFTDDELLWAKAVAFWAAAALVRVQQLEQLRRYSTLLEQVVYVAQHVFEGEAADALCRRILDGACPDGSVGCFVLLDPNGESPEDRLLDSYASRVAAAWRHASLRSGRS